MERQRKKALALKAREEANAELKKDPNAEGSETTRAPEMPPPLPSTEQVIEPISSEEALDSIEDLFL